ncbi:uncharacterized protein PV09_03882 [Verruconis gallopava]|uniref:Thioesterase domain-containing protein n=1 Tax=Verruconis gallopava TaxID=253628 RepID=A0A0D1XRQ0_9PEZI|nr:uncharacterized protein PV09_03882 [Verruconis gallopava]KIW05366.1 hypothetical protein PV09_03882 [Verruconis gallopava]
MVLESPPELGSIHNIVEFMDKMPVPQSDLEFFSSIPYVKHYLQDRDSPYKPAAFYSVYTKPNDPTADLFFARTIATEDTIPHRLLLMRKGVWPLTNPAVGASNAKQRPFAAPETPEIIILYDLKAGMNGFANTAHGGAMCALLDETLGMCAEVHRQTQFKDQKTMLYTAQLNTSFLAPIKTPGVVRVKAWMLGREGRKWKLRAQMDDCQGQVLLETESLWISTKEEGNL